MEPDPHNLNPGQTATLKTLRVWAGVAMGFCALLPLAAVVVARAWVRETPPAEQTAAGRAAVALFVAATVLGIGGRMQAYKANWRGDVVTPGGYRKGILRFIGAVAGGYAAASGVGLWVGNPLVARDLVIFALILLFFGFPNGKPMLPAPPQLGHRKP